jgi:hypothetical protein
MKIMTRAALVRLVAFAPLVIGSMVLVGVLGRTGAWLSLGLFIPWVICAEFIFNLISRRTRFLQDANTSDPSADQ